MRLKFGTSDPSGNPSELDAAPCDDLLSPKSPLRKHIVYLSPPVRELSRVHSQVSQHQYNLNVLRL